jgi:hypothetical protein
MCEIKDFLINHPGISIHWVEKQCGIPISTIKLHGDRPIPTKYIQPIKELLASYGWMDTDVPELSIPTVPTGKRYIVRNNNVGYMDGFLFRRIELPNDTIVVVLE